jgi:acyl carrier protein
MTTAADDIEAEVRACIAESLAIEPKDVLTTSRLVDDLGADSLDFVDILFSLEKRLGLRLRSVSVDAFLRAEFAESDLVEGRFVPQAKLEPLLQWLPALAQADDASHITPAQVYSYITVETFVRIAHAAAWRGAG